MGASFSDFKPGDKVIISIKDVKTIQDMQQNHGGWNPAMHELIEKPSTIIQCIGPDVVVTADSGKVCRVNSELLTKYTRDDARGSETVQIIADESRMTLLQQGHGGWSDGMRSMLGQTVQLIQRYQDNDCLVKFNNKCWTINPQCIASVGDTTNTPNTVKVGDNVKMIKDVDQIKRLQINHGGWSDLMMLIVGETVEVVKIFDDGDFFVSKFGMEWLINPHCVDTSFVGKPASSADLKRGDFVQISTDIELSEEMQENHGGWLSVMKLFAGKCGRVDEVLFSGDVKVNINGMSLVYNPILLTKTDAIGSGMKYSPGDKVRVIKDIDKVKRLQKGHGEWNDSMALVLGKVGKVKSLYLDGDLRVKLLGNTVTLNPECVELAETDDDSDQDVPDLLELLQKMATNLLIDAGQSTQIFMGDDANRGKPLNDHDKIFMLSLKAGNLSEVRNFVDSVDVNKPINSVSPLMIATIDGHLDIVRLLLDKNADVNAKTSTGDTALHLAVNGNFHDICVALVSHGADLNMQNDNKISPLMLAAHSGSLDTLQFLLTRSNANLNLGDKDGDTPLHLAIQKSRVEFVETLLDAGADIMALNAKQFSAYHLAAMRGNERILEILLKKGGPSIVNSQKDDKFTALHLAAINNHTACIKLLIKYNADLNIRNKTLQTALHVAVSQRYLECVKILVESKAQLDLKDNGGDTPLHDAVRIHNMDRIKKMSSLVGLGDMFKLIEGIHKGSDKPEDIVMYLAENGARIDLQNNSGQTPLTMCEDAVLTAKLKTIQSRSKPKGIEESKDPPPFSPVPAEKTRDEELEELRRKIKEMEEDKKCVICLDRRINVTFDCGHVTCDVCATNLSECHMCRKTILRMIRIFN